MTNKVNLLEKFGLFDERFHPKIVGDLNDLLASDDNTMLDESVFL